ncbi:MAG: FAD-binding oxidoreductase [Planctomycetaceae bacterium]
MSFPDGVVTVSGDAPCAEVEERVRPWLFASDRPDLTVAQWIDRGGGDLLWGLLGPTRAQVLGIRARLQDGSVVRFGGTVVKNVAGYDLARAFAGARGRLGRILEAHLRVRPPPRGWRAARLEGTVREDAERGPGSAVWSGATVRWLRRGEPTPEGYEECDPIEARAALRPAWSRVRSFLPAGPAPGILLATPRIVGSEADAPERSDPLFRRLCAAFAP